MARSTGFMCAGLAAVAAFSIYAHASHWVSTTPGARATESSDALEREVEALQRELGALRTEQQLFRVTAANSQAAAEAAPAAPAEPADPAIAPVEDGEPPEAAETFASVGTLFDTEPRDATWADRTEGQLQVALSTDAIPGVTVRRAKCASTLCRLETDALDQQSFERFTQELPSKTSFLPSGRFERIPTEDGTIKAVYYLRREAVPDPAEG